MHTVPGEWIKITKYSTTEENPRTHLEQTSAIVEHVNFIVIQVKNDERTEKKEPAQHQQTYVQHMNLFTLFAMPL